MACGETSFSSYTFTYKWKINDLEMRLYDPSELSSPVFSSPPGAQPATKWMLIIFKQDHPLTPPVPHDVQYLSVKLQRVLKSTESGAKLKQITVPLLNVPMIEKQNLGENVCVETILKPPTIIGRRKNENGPIRWTTFTSRRQTRQSKPSKRSIKFVRCDGSGPSVISGKRYLARSEVRGSQCVIFECEIKVWLSDKPIHVTKEPSPVYEFSTNKSDFNLSKCIQEAHQSNIFTDVTLVADGKEFKAHKVVLASQSEFFKTRFSSRWTGSRALGYTGDRVEMTDVPAVAMEALLSYMYTGKVAHIEKIAYKLLPVAEEYGLVGLRNMCEEALIKLLTTNTVISTLIHAVAHNAPDLKKVCIDFIVSNTAAVRQSEGWDKLKKEQPHHDLWVELLENIAEKH